MAVTMDGIEPRSHEDHEAVPDLPRGLRMPNESDSEVKSKAKSAATRPAGDVTEPLRGLRDFVVQFRPRENHLAFPSSNASWMICSALGPFSLSMMQLILISLVVMFWMFT